MKNRDEYKKRVKTGEDEKKQSKQYKCDEKDKEEKK